MPVSARGLIALRALFDLVEKEASIVGAQFAREKLSGSGSGIHYVGLPNTSSLPSEYPAEQTGELLNSVDNWFVAGDGWVFGLHDAPIEAVMLEFKPVGMGGRPLMMQMFADTELHTTIINHLAERFSSL